MTTISSDKEVWEMPNVLVPEDANTDIFADESPDFPLLLGAPLFRQVPLSMHASVAKTSDENETLSTVMDDDLVDSMLESCFQSAQEMVYANEITADSSYEKDSIATAMQESAGDITINGLTTETLHSSPFSSQGSFEDSFPMMERPETSPERVILEEMESKLNPPYIPHLKLETKTSSRRSSPGKIAKKKKTRAPARPWSDEEHHRFKESLELFGRNWERCAAYIGTRRAQLVRSHAQKYLIKLWKLGEPLPKKVAESGNGYTLSGKPLHADSASARSYLTKIPCPNISQE